MAGYNILLLGSGGREDALAWKIAQSPLLNQLYASPGNAGIARHATCLALKATQDILDFCQLNAIDLVVIGPEQPLVEGVSDALREAGFAVFGCSQAAAQLEGSKGFTKDLCRKYNIPTAAYARFDALSPALNYLHHKGVPIVIKADGLAAGKGVTVAETMVQAEQALEDVFDGRFGEAGSSVVIEEFLEGEEASFFAISDGETVRAFAAAQDHKRVGDGDTGPNTGGMGTYSPAPVFTPEVEARTMREIIEPTIAAMQAEGHPFVGVLFAGLMIKDGVPKLIEYNVRFGDPETQVLMRRLESDIVPLFIACAKGDRLSQVEVQFTDQAALCVVMAAKGYPGEYQKSTRIENVEKAEAQQDVVVFHAGTARQGGELLAMGGRVLGVAALGKNVPEAQAKAYKAVDTIDWPEGFCRRDIGWRAIKP